MTLAFLCVVKEALEYSNLNGRLGDRVKIKRTETFQKAEPARSIKIGRESRVLVLIFTALLIAKQQQQLKKKCQKFSSTEQK